VPYVQPDPENLTPGVLDGYALRAFKYGACGALALALHDARGWPLIAVTDAHNVHDGHAGGGSSMHYMVRHPNGKLLDVDGFHDDSDIIEDYEGEADNGEAAIGIAHRMDVREWYVEAQGEPIPVTLAASFVDAVVERALNASSVKTAE
jgi:hypothetical protein